MPYTVYTTVSSGPEVFNGFSRWTGKSDQIAVVRFDGEPTIYDVDDGAHPDDVDAEIKRLYLADYEREPEKISQYQIAH